MKERYFSDGFARNTADHADLQDAKAGYSCGQIQQIAAEAISREHGANNGELQTIESAPVFSEAVA
jgi:hypothetical protein